MKVINRFLFATILLFIFQPTNVFAQLAGANIIAHGVLAVAGGGKQAKQEKIIEQSTTQEKIAGSNVMVLRVKESDIKSKAKNNIITLQNRLNQYHTQYQNNLPLNIPKNDSDLIAIQDKDENWPTEDYVGELRAYKRYAFQQKQKAATAPATTNSLQVPVNNVRKDSAAAKL